MKTIEITETVYYLPLEALHYDDVFSPGLDMNRNQVSFAE